MKRKYFICLFIFAFVFCNQLFSGNAHASTYEVHLFYDGSNNFLRFDNKQSAVSLDTQKEILYNEFFENQNEIKESDFVLKVQPINGSEIDTMKFNKKMGNFDLEIPFFVSGKTINIYDFESGQKILSTDISSFSVCNSNGICEYEKGENFFTCVADCGRSHPNFSAQTIDALNSSRGEIKDPKTGDILLKDPGIDKSNNSLSSTQTDQKNMGPVLTPTVEQENQDTTSTKKYNFLNYIIIIGLAIASAFGLFYAYKQIRKRK